MQDHGPDMPVLYSKAHSLDIPVGYRPELKHSCAVQVDSLDIPVQ